MEDPYNINKCVAVLEGLNDLQMEEMIKDVRWVSFADIDLHPISSLTKKAMKLIANKI